VTVLETRMFRTMPSRVQRTSSISRATSSDRLSAPVKPTRRGGERGNRKFSTHKWIGRRFYNNQRVSRISHALRSASRTAASWEPVRFGCSRHWIESAEVKSGPILRPIGKGGKIGTSRLGDRSVALIVSGP
jgi:hypothetical protein